MAATAIPRESEDSQPPQHHSPRFASRTSRRLGEGTRNVLKRLGDPAGRFAQDEHAFLKFQPVLAALGSVLLLIIGVPVILGALDDGLPKIVTSVGNITTTFKNADWGDETANSLSPTMGMVLSITAVVAMFGFAVTAVYFAKKSKSG